MVNVIRKSNAFLNILSLIISFALFLFVVIYGRTFGGGYADMLYCLLGALIAGVLNAFFHEFGHYVSGKKSGFYLLEFQVLFFCFFRQGKDMKFSFKFSLEEAGKTVMVPKKNANLKAGIKRVTNGGIIASFIMFLLGFIPVILALIIPEKISPTLYYLTSVFLPIGAYYFFGNFIPKINSGARNDGAVLSSIKNEDDAYRVTENLYAIYSELYNGKSPSEIDESLYFNIPQLPEDDALFLSLLDARYSYFLDKKDYENAKKTLNRLLALEDYMTDGQKLTIKAEALFSVCTYNFNETKADDYTLELEKYLNNKNDALRIRAKTAYLKNVVKETENLPDFYDKWEKEADKLSLKGLSKYEKNLLQNLKAN